MINNIISSYRINFLIFCVHKRNKKLKYKTSPKKSVEVQNTNQEVENHRKTNPKKQIPAAAHQKSLNQVIWVQESIST